MASRARLIACMVPLALFACGGDGASGGDTDDSSTNSGSSNSGSSNSGNSNSGNSSSGDSSSGGGGPVDPPTLDAPCDAPEAVELTSATEVGTAAELRAALASGGEILLTADIAADGPFEVNAPTVLDGGGFEVNGQGTTHLFVAGPTEFTIQHITLADAVNTLPDSEHFSRRSGAGLVMLGGGAGTLSVFDVRFNRNRIGATGPGDLRGGGLYAFTVPDVLVVDSEFVDNVGSNGGAIGGLGSSFTIINTSFLGNSTNGEGGPGSLEGRGGAISLDALSQNSVTAYLDVCGSHFENNETKHAGGAIALVTHQWSGATVDIDQSTFIGNRTSDSAGGSGGAIYLLDDDNYPMVGPANRSVISNSFFHNNETLGGGGGLWYFTNGGSLDLVNSTFFENQTYSMDLGMGGAAALVSGVVRISDCTFASNFARFHGGGIQAPADVDVTVTNSLFHNNTSDRPNGWAWFHANRELTDGGGNMQFTSPELVIDGNSDLPVAAGATFADARPMPPADNGGPTPTMALAEGSPAIDGGVSVEHAVDQRGMPHVGAPDVGAFEMQ